MACRDELGLLPEAELIESGFYECKACASEQRLIQDIVEAAGNDTYYDRAMAAFQLAEMFESYGWKPEAVEAKALDDLIVIRAEQVRFEMQKAKNSSGGRQQTTGEEGEVE